MNTEAEADRMFYTAPTVAKSETVSEINRIIADIGRDNLLAMVAPDLLRQRDELLSACKLLCEPISQNDEHRQWAISHAKAAIASVEGGQQ